MGVSRKMFNFYDSARFHQFLEYSTPCEIYYKAFNNERVKKNSLKKEDILQIFLKSFVDKRAQFIINL